jgi:hypothetical protein
MPTALPREERGVAVIDPTTPFGAYLASEDVPASTEAAFAGILRTMAGARQGERQCVCFWCANRTFELIRDGGLDHADAVAALEDVAVSAGLSLRRVSEVIQRVEKAVLA